MGAFKFRLQSVLEIREREERDAGVKLVDAEGKADEARVAKQALEDIREKGAAAMHVAHAPTIGQINTIGYVLEQLNHHIADAQTRVAAAEQVVTQARADLTSALQARRVLSKLRDKHFENWQKEDNAKEMQQMDEFALSRFARQSKDDNNGAAS